MKDIGFTMEQFGQALFRVCLLTHSETVLCKMLDRVKRNEAHWCWRRKCLEEAIQQRRKDV